jgi:hypothetical protein
MFSNYNNQVTCLAILMIKQSHSIYFEGNNNPVKYHFIGFDSILFLNFQAITFLKFIDEIE